MSPSSLSVRASTQTSSSLLLARSLAREWMQLLDNVLKRETLRLKINMKRLTAQFAFRILFRCRPAVVAVKIIIYIVDTMKQRNSNHFACKENGRARCCCALDGGREGDSYQINKMEWNKNNANAINAASIGALFASLLLLLSRTCRSRARRSLEDGCELENRG